MSATLASPKTKNWSFEFHLVFYTTRKSDDPSYFFPCTEDGKVNVKNLCSAALRNLEICKLNKRAGCKIVIERTSYLNGDIVGVKEVLRVQDMRPDFQEVKDLPESVEIPVSSSPSHYVKEMPWGWQNGVHIAKESRKPDLLELEPLPTEDDEDRLDVPDSPVGDLSENYGIDRTVRSTTRLVQDGTYTCVFEDGSYRTLKIVTVKNGGLAGKTIVKYLSGADNESDYTGFAFIDPFTGKFNLWKKFRGNQILSNSIQTLLKDPSEAGLSYAMRSGNCYRCGRKLTVPSSLHRGLGPECAKRVG